MARHRSGHPVGRVTSHSFFPCPAPATPGLREAVRGPWPQRDCHLLSLGLYAGIKFFLIDFVFKRCPRLRAKYDTPYIVWRSLPTDPQLKERSSTAVSRRVGWPRAGRTLAAPCAWGGCRLPDLVGPLKPTEYGPRGPGQPLGKAVPEAPSCLEAPQIAPPRTCLSHAGPQAEGRQGAGCWSCLPRAWGPWEAGATLWPSVPQLRLGPTSCPQAGMGPVFYSQWKGFVGVGPWVPDSDTEDELA